MRPLLINVIASVLLVEMGDHSLATELTFLFLKEQHLDPLESAAS